ncbi:alpha-2-macroglobulin family protein [Danxiaibacter flavus]|uniref:Alpha-2-macroglobulin family protein n=1 Tax=Danxiaibacter flavus TaxID=3049108 RepID=A0ABV3ZGC3_9BACT|nr:alpha-2-macroglobulin family protein [Chitinophagaceae bacterium DXS]
MQRLLVILFLALPLIGITQIDWKNLKKKSDDIFTYRVTTAEAEKYIKLDSIPVDVFLPRKPDYVLKRYYDQDSLPTGHYILLSVDDINIKAEIINVTRLYVSPTVNRNVPQIQIRNTNGGFVTNAQVWDNGHKTTYIPQAQAYRLKKKIRDEVAIKIFAPGDSTFLILNGDNFQPYSYKKHFPDTRVGKVITWLPRKISPSHAYHKYSDNNKAAGARGYILFNQPKYKLTDTVKLKAYIINKHQKQYTNNLRLYLQFYKNGSAKSQLLSTLSPSSPGAYVYSFPLHDSLPSDATLSIVFKTEKEDYVLSGNFKTEDYLPDEISTYNFTSTRKDYFYGDSLLFEASAQDANHLTLLDASAKLILTTSTVSKFYGNQQYIADTIYTEQKKLLTEGKTPFVVPVKYLPAADVTLKALLQFRNSNNELHEQTLTLTYNAQKEQLVTWITNDTLYADYRINNKSVNTVASMEMDGNFSKEQEVGLPYKSKIDPFAESYNFFIEKKDSGSLYSSIDIPANYNVPFSRISSSDTIGFSLYNNYKIPVSYLVLDGKKIVASGTDSTSVITWEKKMTLKHKGYTVLWQYVWGGKQKEQQDRIGLLYSKLNIEVNTSASVYPGQQDAVKIHVSDYKHTPVPNVNLAAVSYNSQITKNFYVPDPPYTDKHKIKSLRTKGVYENDDHDPYFSKKYLLGKHQQWKRIFGVDSIFYYKLLFPEKAVTDVTTRITSYLPQVSIHVTDNGIPQSIALLYINRGFMYMESSADTSEYCFQASTSFIKVGVRLRNCFFEVDSIYMQPNYKHDVVIDMSKLAKEKIKPMPEYFTTEERKLIEKQMMRVRNNYGYLWQGTKVTRLSGQDMMIGPFNDYDSLHFYQPANYDLHFVRENGYEYNFSPKILRLERKPIYAASAKKIMINETLKSWNKWGDTLSLVPVINYEKVEIHEPYIADVPQNITRATKTGHLLFTAGKDSTLNPVAARNIRRIALVPIMENGQQLVATVTGRYAFTKIEAGEYMLYLIDSRWNTASGKIQIRQNRTLCIATENWKFAANDPIVKQLEYETKRRRKTDNNPIKVPVTGNKPQSGKLSKGSSSLTGNITDSISGKPVPYALVRIHDNFTNGQTDVATDSNGIFHVQQILEGTYNVSVYALGYNEKSLIISLSKGEDYFLQQRLSIGQLSLNEVVVVGYGVSRKSDITASISSGKTSNLLFLQGKAAGVYVGYAATANSISIRGLRTFSASEKPLYVVDGILYEDLPASISPDTIASVEVMKSTEASAIYGARAFNGAVIITTKKTAGGMRKNFRDYAFWQPNLITDKNGQASFFVNYPDNITGWETYVIAIDKKLRTGKAMLFTQSFKPLLAQLNTPQFLIEGDSAVLIGKAMNYTNDSYKAQLSFSLQQKQLLQKKQDLEAKQSTITRLPILVPTNSDSLLAAFELQSQTGFKDGEERKIPVLKKGIEETKGIFWQLHRDTTVTFTADANAQNVEISILNNGLELMLKEIEHLKDYPYACMEQTASKLRGLLMERQIREYLSQSFKEDKTINLLLNKLQKAQHFDGSWSWWENGRSSIDITCYVINALLPVRSQQLVGTSIRNGLLYLQSQLPTLNRKEMLTALLTLSEAGHFMEYGPYLKTIPFDSISVHGQWQYVRIMQNLKADYSKQLNYLINKGTRGILGGLHWGDENYRWQNNATSTTLLAHQVIVADKSTQSLQPNITQYFMEQRRNGYWRNTVESAGILSAILPVLLNENKKIAAPATISVSGDTSFTVTHFPFHLKTGANKTHLELQKTGGGITYASIYQKLWNPQPQINKELYNIYTAFTANGQEMETIKAGEKVKMIITIEVEKEAEYVMIEIPIPAGCTYAEKSQDSWQTHKEFFKNKVALFAGHLAVGKHKYEVELEARYTGSYTLNPAKVELMYFPTFYGRNEMKKVSIN